MRVVGRVQRRVRHRLARGERRERENLGRLVGSAVARREHLPQPLHRAGVQLRDARLVDPDLGADLLHGDLAEVVHPDDPLLAGRKRPDGGPHALADFLMRVELVGQRRFGRLQHGRQLSLLDVLAGEQRRGRLDRVDAHDRAPEAGLVVPDARRQVGQRRVASRLAAKLLARRFELAAHAAHPARPGVLPERVDHRPADAALGEGLELDAAALVEAVRRVDETQHPVLDEIAQIDRVGHRGGHAACQRLDKREAAKDAISLCVGDRLPLHRSLRRNVEGHALWGWVPGVRPRRGVCRTGTRAMYGNGGASPAHPASSMRPESRARCPETGKPLLVCGLGEERVQPCAAACHTGHNAESSKN